MSESCSNKLVDFINRLIKFPKVNIEVKQIYILTNMFLDQNLILYNSEKPIKKSFWIIDNYADMIPEHCKFLQTYDSTNYNINDEINMHKILNKFKKAKSLEEEEQSKSRQIRGFKLISFAVRSEGFTIIN